MEHKSFIVGRIEPREVYTPKNPEELHEEMRQWFKEHGGSIKIGEIEVKCAE